MRKSIYILAASISLTVFNSSAQTFPLSENTWSNPEFVERFLGSYGFDTSVTPSITSDEMAIFDSISTMIAEDPATAITILSESITPESSPATIYTLGNLHLQLNETEEAIKYYKQAIEAFPNFLRAYKNLGIVYVQNGVFEEGTQMLLKSLELGAQGSDVYGLLGYAYLNQGNSVSALSAYENALFYSPKSMDWRMGKVQCLSNMHRFDDAIAMIDNLIEEFPNQTDLLMLQANAFIAKDQPEDAAASLEILRSTGTAKASAMMLLGDIYLNFRQPELALDSYREVAKDSELSADRALRIARRLAAAAAWEETDNFLSIVEGNISDSLDSKDELELLNLKAQSDLAQNRNAEAAEKLTIVVSKDPLNGKALLLLANYYWSNDDVERAEIYYERATKISDVAPDALVQHARMLVSIREYEKAVPLLERAQMLEPKTHVGQYLEKVAAASKSVKS